MNAAESPDCPGRLRLGACSWKYGSWRGLVYSAEKGINFLEEYARKYDTVEIDQWFWSLFNEKAPGLPRPTDVGVYADSVPPDFSFTIKIPNSLSLTHFYARSTGGVLKANPFFLSRQVWNDFCERLGPILPATGMLIFQFEYLNRQKMNSPAEFRQRLAGFLDGLPRPAPLGLEIRNPNYLTEDFFVFLKSVDLAPVFCQGYFMPDIKTVIPKARPSFEKGRAVIRLMGNDREGIEEATGRRYDRVVTPRDEDLAGLALAINRMLAAGMQLFVNVNNHYEGSAPLTMEKIRRLIESPGAA